MLPATEQLSDFYSEQANEIIPCSELNPFLNMLHVRIFPIQKMISLHFIPYSAQKTSLFCWNQKCIGLARVVEFHS